MRVQCRISVVTPLSSGELHGPREEDKIPSFRGILWLEICPLAMQMLTGEHVTSGEGMNERSRSFPKFLILPKPLQTLCE